MKHKNLLLMLQGETEAEVAAYLQFQFLFFQCPFIF